LQQQPAVQQERRPWSSHNATRDPSFSSKIFLIFSLENQCLVAGHMQMSHATSPRTAVCFDDYEKNTYMYRCVWSIVLIDKAHAGQACSVAIGRVNDWRSKYFNSTNLLPPTKSVQVNYFG
jgi:hypothetical protein